MAQFHRCRLGRRHAASLLLKSIQISDFLPADELQLVLTDVKETRRNHLLFRRWVFSPNQRLFRNLEHSHPAVDYSSNLEDRSSLSPFVFSWCFLTYISLGCQVQIGRMMPEERRSR